MHLFYYYIKMEKIKFINIYFNYINRSKFIIYVIDKYR